MYSYQSRSLAFHFASMLNLAVDSGLRKSDIVMRMSRLLGLSL